MRTFSVPGKYAAELESVISAAVDRIRLDEFRRQHGEPPVVQDFMLDETRRQDAFAIVVVGAADESVADGVLEAIRQRRKPA